MSQVRQQPVGNIDCAVREADQPLPQLDPWEWAYSARADSFDLVRIPALYAFFSVSQRQGRIAEMARYPDIIARPRTARRSALPFATSPMIVTQIFRGPR